MVRRSRIFEDRFKNSWNEIKDSVVYGVIAPLANDLDSLAAVDEKGKLVGEAHLHTIAANFFGCRPRGFMAQLAWAVGLGEHVRDPFHEAQAAMWGMCGLGNMIAIASSTYGNVQVDRYGLVQGSAQGGGPDIRHPQRLQRE